jgi:RecB family exonuclease
MRTDKLSASKLKTFQWCQFRYYLTYEAKLPEMNRPSKATEVGSVVHEVLEKYALGEKDWEKQLDHSLVKFAPWKLIGEEMKDVDECPKDMREACMKMIQTAFDRDDKPFSRKIVGTPEQKFDENLSKEIPVLGYIDLVTEIDKDTIEIRDWKTGKQAKEGELREDLQPKIYDLVAMVLWPQYLNRLLTFDYLKGKPISFRFTDEERMVTLREIEELSNTINKIKVPNRIIDIEPKQRWRCSSWCFGLNKCDNLYEKYFPV